MNFLILHLFCMNTNDLICGSILTEKVTFKSPYHTDRTNYNYSFFIFTLLEYIVNYARNKVSGVV